jgi:hypothetical protein
VLVRVEMDEDRMSHFSFEALPAWAMLLGLPAYLAVGIVLGILYFRSVWRSACRFAGGDNAMTTIAMMIGRFALLGGLLTLASREGPLPLLVMALGVLIARSVVMRSVGKAVP